MKKIIAVLFIAFSAISYGQTFDINTSNASVYFNYVSEKTTGTLTGVKTTVTIDPANLSASKVSGTVKVSTISTKNKMRDKHLQSADFFDAERFPVMKFETGEIIQEGDGYTAKGRLTIKETTKNVSFKVSETDGALKFKTTIYSADYGVSVKKDREKSKVVIVVKVPIG